jgi:hypothetical protein
LQGTSGTVPSRQQGERSVFGHQTAATDTKPRTGMESATTVNVCNSATTHGNEGQDMALGTAGHCMHGAKNNRDVKDTHFHAIRRSAAPP